MKENAFDITRSFRVGLRREEKVQVNRPGMAVATNVVLTEYGLERYESVIDPFDGALGIAYPYPQVFRGSKGTLLFDKTAVRSVVEGGDPWSSSPVTTVGIDGVGKSITGDGVWHFADLGDAWYAFNGTSVVFRTGLDRLANAAVSTFIQNAVSINTGCSHQGRVIVGGFDNTDFWSSAWQTILTAWKGDDPAGTDAQSDDIDASYILWSTIGVNDFPLWLFYPDVYGALDVGPTAADALDRSRIATWGYMAMPFSGAVLAIIPLGGHIVVYGEDGIAMLSPYANDLVGGYGLTRSWRIGVYGRNSVVGNEERHYFIDPTGALWELSTRSLKRLGYTEYLSPELSASMRMSLEDGRGYTYISGGTNGFVYTGYGLTQTTQRVPSVDFVEGATLGVVSDSTADDASWIYLTTSPFDLGYRGQKTFTGIEISISTAYVVEVSLLYKYKVDDVWRQHRWVRVNKDGYAYMRVSAVSFQVQVRVKGTDDVDISFANIRWQASDKKYRRGFIQVPDFQQEEERDAGQVSA